MPSMQPYNGPLTETPFVEWNPDPVIFYIPGTDHPVVWYGLFFALAFVGSHFIMNRIFKAEFRTAKELDKLTLYVVAGTVIGARLGHCLFYGPLFDENGQEGYLSHPLNILKVWEGGLASHGGAIGILTALWLYARKTKENLWWIFDRIVIAVALSGFCIRMGNLMNSEIVGKPTDLPWAFRFIGCSEDRETLMAHGEALIKARHPSQLYEALYCVFLLVFFFWMWKKKRNSLPQGTMFGMFCLFLFTFRFLIEFTKETQVDFEKAMPIDMGQILSLPFVIAGFAIILWSKKKNVFHAIRTEAPEETQENKK